MKIIPLLLVVGKQVYVQGADYYPRKLWQAILKTVKG